ncbi:hypothetical protein E2C01_027753 [Portunus trituberculatus]|uniref:Saposin B-type domain-containing protein n=1 Tax=Portunus trituberculatus TaxID=210409 RepID=A0A5B7EMH4_PORTR|nr:hypothetical protein [Portunus trituberculatus]
MDPSGILDGLCHQTGKFSKNCLALVDEYYEPLYNLLVSEIHPKQICEAVGLCGETSVFSQLPPVWTLLKPQLPGVVSQVPLLPALPVQHEPGSRMTGQDEAAAINHEHQGDQTLHLPRVSLSGSGIAVSHVGTNGVVAPAVGKTNIKDDNKCVMCEFVMQFLRNMLEQKDTRGML